MNNENQDKRINEEELNNVNGGIKFEIPFPKVLPQAHETDLPVSDKKKPGEGPSIGIG